MIQPTAKIQVSVVPRSAKAGIAVSETSVVKVHLTSPPVEGRANEELISLLARRLHVPKIAHHDTRRLKRQNQDSGD